MTATPPEAVPPAQPAPPVVPPAPPAPSAPPTPPVPPVSDKGFPDNTPLAEMTAEQQAAYWKHYARQHEGVAKARADYDDLKAKADELDALKAASATEQEKAVKAASEAARTKALQETTPRLVAAEFRAASAGRHTPEQLAAILEPLDMSKFLDPKGNVDTAKVDAFINSVTPAPAKPGFPDLGQGRRPGGAGPSVAAGREMFAAGKKPATT